MKLKTSEQAWSGCYIEKKDEIQNEGEGKESLKMVWGGGGDGVRGWPGGNFPRTKQGVGKKRRPY
jgi:hypothetical protein